MRTTPAYDHVQRGRFHYLLHFMVLPVAAIAVPLDLVWMPLPLAVAAVLEIVALSFHSLRVRDEGDRLGVRFGPLPLLKRTLAYEDIRGVERGRSALIDGWGVHWVPFRGWTWNLWGRDCVRVDLGERSLRIGTDDPEGLETFLKARTAALA